jgi:hypothetical protein
MRGSEYSILKIIRWNFTPVFNVSILSTFEILPVKLMINIPKRILENTLFAFVQSPLPHRSNGNNKPPFRYARSN